MSDVCTLVISTFITTQACVLPPHCEQANGKTYCIPATTEACPPAEWYYDCVSDDGSHYLAPWGEYPRIHK